MLSDNDVVNFIGQAEDTSRSDSGLLSNVSNSQHLLRQQERLFARLPTLEETVTVQELTLLATG